MPGLNKELLKDSVEVLLKSLSHLFNSELSDTNRGIIAERSRAESIGLLSELIMTQSRNVSISQIVGLS